jgi:uncharacterized protein YkwD
LYNGKRFERPGEIPIITQEGVAALDGEIRYRRAAKPVSPLDLSMGLSRAARDHAKDLGRTGAMGHKGSDGSDPWERMSRYGPWKRKVAENIAYGSDHARHIVMQQVIDDGVLGRRHRTNLFNPNFHFVGIGCESHVRYRNVCVIDFAEGYSEKSRAGLR